MSRGYVLTNLTLDSVVTINKKKKIFKDKNYPILIDEEGGNVSRLNKIIDTSIFSAKSFGDLFGGG